MVASDDLSSGLRVLRTLRLFIAPALGGGVGVLGRCPENMFEVSPIEEPLAGMPGYDSERVWLTIWVGLLTIRSGLG